MNILAPRITRPLLAFLCLAAPLWAQPALLCVKSPPRLGTSVACEVAAPGNGGKSYVAALSFAPAAGIALGDGRSVALGIDALLQVSLIPGIAEFVGFQGTLDARGEANLQINVPSEPALDGIELAMGAVVLDGASSAGVAAISQPVRMRLQASMTTPDFSAVSARVQAAITAGALNGAGLLVVDRFGPRLTQFFGNTTANSVYPIASATKWISAMLLMTMVDDGLLSLDTTLGTHYPSLSLLRRGITLRQLFSHTSGLAANAPCMNSDTTTLQACADQILGLPLQYLPGTAFSYGGTSMHVAGAVAELAAAAAGAPASWNQLFATRFLQPLGLGTMSFGAGPNPRVAGGITCNLADLAPVLRMLLAGGDFGATEVLSANSLATMLAETGEGLPVLSSPGAALQAIGYGFGVWRLDEDTNRTTATAASMGAFGSAFWIDYEVGYGAWLFTLDQGTADAAAVIADLRPLLRDALD
jgi:CubicO group peptidase (beta-lactamase class C family)